MEMSCGNANSCVACCLYLEGILINAAVFVGGGNSFSKYRVTQKNFYFHMLKGDRLLHVETHVG